MPRKPTTIYIPKNESSESIVLEKPEKSKDWFAWIWRIGGATLIAVIATLGVSLLNQQNSQINNLADDNSTLNKQVGELQGRLTGIDERISSVRQFQLNMNEKYQKKDEDMQKEIQGVKDRVLLIEAHTKAENP
jgi:predicted nuclease with TOPRIM domain